MDCKDICELLTAYLDGEATPEDKAYIEAHLPGCPQCRAELEALSATQAILRGVLKSMAEEVTPSVQAWEKVRARLDTKGGWLDGLHRLLTSRTWQVATVTAVVVVIAVVAAIWQFGGVEQAPVPALAPVAPAPAPAPTPEPTPTPTPAPTPSPIPPAPMPAPPPPFERSVVPEEAHYLPGEPVEVKLSLTNVSSETIKLDRCPPEIQVTPR
jgi:phage gpG-like protein